MSRLIDADALIESLSINPEECPGCPEPEWLEELACVLALAPTIERKKGKWISGIEIPKKGKRIFHKDITYCSNCHNEAYWDTDYGQQTFDYCPYCGAEMRGDPNV